MMNSSETQLMLPSSSSQTEEDKKELLDVIQHISVVRRTSKFTIEKSTPKISVLLGWTLEKASMKVVDNNNNEIGVTCVTRDCSTDYQRFPLREE